MVELSANTEYNDQPTRIVELQQKTPVTDIGYAAYPARGCAVERARTRPVFYKHFNATFRQTVRMRRLMHSRK